MADSTLPGGGPGGNRREAVRAVSADRPCPVCGGDHKCAVGDGGLILCGRRDGPVPGFRHLGPSRGDPQFHLYRRDDGPPPRPGGGKPADWPAAAERFAATRQDASLAAALGLPEGVLAAMPLLGADPARGCWTFPECDAAGTVIGISRRFPDGTKKAMKGGKRGLSLVTGWRDRPGPVLLAEGPSDTPALTACGLAAVGRPSNTGGAALLAGLLADLPADRAVIVLGENDRKPDVTWPGRDGAARTAAELSRRLGRPVPWALPPRTARRTHGRGCSTKSPGRRRRSTGRGSAATCSPPAGRSPRPAPTARRSS